MFKFRKYFKEVLKDKESNKYIEQAELIINNELKYIHPYDMEKCSKEYTIPNTWNETPNGDEEWIFMRSRMGYLDSLFLAYEDTIDKRYVEKVIGIIDEFIDTHTPITKELSTRTLDSGIRIFNILRSMWYLEELNMLTDKFKNKIINHIKETSNYLFDSYLLRYDQSNWGLIQMASVYIFGMIYDKKLEKEAYKKLIMQVKTQVMPDGMHWENSLTYHIQVMIYLALVVMVEKKKNKKSVFTKYLKLTNEAAKKLIYPDGNQINFGDSDDVDIRGVIAMCDTILGTPSQYKLDIEAKMCILDFSEKYVYSKRNNNGSWVFPVSGYYNKIKDNFSFSTYLSPMSSAHTNMSFMHFNYYNQKKIFVDTGRYTYVDGDMRRYLRGELAHNTLVIDDIMSSNITGSWDQDGYPTVMPIRRQKYKDFEAVELNMYDKKNSSLIRRIFVILEENILIVDSVFCKGNHKLKTYFNLHPNVKIKKEKGCIILNDLVKFIPGEYIVDKGYYSKEYNDIEKNLKIVCEQKFKNEIHTLRSILTQNTEVKMLPVYRNGEKYEDNSIFAVNLKTDKYSYDIFFKLNEVYSGAKVFHVNNNPMYMNLQYIKRRKK